MYTSVCLLLVSLLALSQQAHAGSVILDHRNFAKEVDGSNAPYFVLFGGPMDPSLEVDTFEQLSDKISPSGIKVGRVDCTGSNRRNKMICASILSFGGNGQQQNVGLPQMAMYVGEPENNPYTKKKFRKPTLLPMMGADNQPLQITEKDVERFIVRSLPHTIRKVNTMAQLINRTAEVAIDFPSDPQPASDGNTRPVAVLLLAKDTVPLVYKVVSHSFSDPRPQPQEGSGKANPDGDVRLQLLQLHLEKSTNIVARIVPKREEKAITEDTEMKEYTVGVPALGVLVSSVSEAALAAGAALGHPAPKQGVVWYRGDMKDAAAMTAFLEPYALAPAATTATKSASAAADGSEADSSSATRSSGKEGDAKGSGGNGASKSKGSGSSSTAPDANKEVLTPDSLLGVQSFNPEYAWVVAVVENDAASEVPGWSSRISRFGEGAVRLAELRCGGEGAERNDTLGHVMCRQATRRPPYVQVLPFEDGTTDPDAVGSYTTDRRKMVLPPGPTQSQVHTVAHTLGKMSFPVPTEADATSSSATVFKEIRRAAWESLPEDSVSLVTEYDMQSFIQDGYVRRGGALTVLILASADWEAGDSGGASVVPSTYRNVALSLGRYYNTQVGIIHDPSPEYLATLDNPPLPTVLVLYPVVDESADADAADVDSDEDDSGFRSGVKKSKNQRAAKINADAKRKLAEPDAGAVKFQIAVYNAMQWGPVKFMSVIQFALTVFGQAGVEPLPTAATAGTGSARRGPAPTVKELTTAEEWEQECGQTGGFRGLCAVGLFTKGGGDEEGEAWRMHTDTMVQVVQALQQDPASATAFAAFKFVALDGACQHAFVESLFGVTAVYLSLPAVLVYSPSKQRYALYQPPSSALEKGEVQTFLQSVISGKVNTIPLPPQPAESPALLPPSECASVYAALGSSAGVGIGIDGSAVEGGEAVGMDADVPMDDFMEEIRREEEEARLAREAELAAEKKQREEEEAAKAAEAKKGPASSGPRKIKRVVKKKKSAGK